MASRTSGRLGSLSPTLLKEAERRLKASSTAIWIFDIFAEYHFEKMPLSEHPGHGRPNFIRSAQGMFTCPDRIGANFRESLDAA